METLVFHYTQGQRRLGTPPRLVGVVSSGNLEVLVHSAEPGTGCEIHVSTAAEGFAAIWQAVMDDFQERWQLRDVRIAINDMGATPAVVRLRLDQAIETCLEPET